MILATQPPGERRQCSSMIHEVFRLHGNGELASIATFEDLLDAERLVETLDWEWPGEYVIRHFVVNRSADTFGQKTPVN